MQFVHCQTIHKFDDRTSVDRTLEGSLLIIIKYLPVCSPLSSPPSISLLSRHTCGEGHTNRFQNITEIQVTQLTD